MITARVYNFDWLEFRVRSERLFEILSGLENGSDDALSFKKIDEHFGYFSNGHGTKHFNNSGILTFRNRKFLLVAFSSRNKNYIDTENVVSLKVMNEQLYYYDTLDVLTTFLKDFEAEIINFTRVDICIDDCKPLKDICDKVFLSAEDKEVVYAGRRDVSAHNMTRNLEKVNYSFGSRASEMRGVLYNKSEEIKKSGKDYILDYWKANGLDTEKNIYRAEITISSKILKNVQGKYGEYWFTDFVAVCHVIMEGFCKMFDFRYNTDKSNISRCQKVEVFDFEQPNERVLLNPKATATDERYKAKLSVKMMLRLIFTSQLDECTLLSLVDATVQTIKDASIKTWWQRKNQYIVEDLTRKAPSWEKAQEGRIAVKQIICFLE